MGVEDDVEARFKLAVPDLQRLIAKRKGSWRLTSVMEWEDCSSMLLTRLWKNFGKYDPTQPLDRWANTVISNAISNLLRDSYVKLSRPCVAATPYGACCSFNLGNGKCGFTASGEQDSSCHFLKKWMDRKQTKFAISSPLSIENHIDESHSMQDDFLDIEAAKVIIDKSIEKRLSREEYRIYCFMYIKHLTIDETIVRMKMKRKSKEDMKAYMHVRQVSLKIKELVKAIISEENLAR